MYCGERCFFSFYKRYGLGSYHPPKPPYDEFVDEIIAKVEAHVFTDEEICSPCPTIAEFDRRKQFLVKIYIDMVKNTQPRWDCYGDDVIYDPISDRFVNKIHKDFVEHHIHLYKELNKTLKPTVFPWVDPYMTVTDKFMIYLTCLPYAEDDDPIRQEAEAYIASHARDISKKYYSSRCREFVVKLVNEGYIKTPTLRKLLDMANDNGDSELSAIILEKLRDKQVSKDRFSV